MLKIRFVTIVSQLDPVTFFFFFPDFLKLLIRANFQLGVFSQGARWTFRPERPSDGRQQEAAAGVWRLP